VTREERREMKAEVTALPVPVVLQRPVRPARQRRVVSSSYLG
jgi:hypothetical protein